MLDNQNPSVQEIRRYTQSILDGRRSIPVSFHEDYRNVTNNFISKVVTHVLAGPDSGSCQVAVEIPCPSNAAAGSFLNKYSRWGVTPRLVSMSGPMIASSASRGCLKLSAERAHSS